jgi:predicted nicotinamide N-methyase
VSAASRAGESLSVKAATRATPLIPMPPPWWGFGWYSGGLRG